LLDPSVAHLIARRRQHRASGFRDQPIVRVFLGHLFGQANGSQKAETSGHDDGQFQVLPDAVDH